MTHRWGDIDGDPGIQPNPPYPMPHVPLDAAYKNHTLRNGQDSTTMVRCNLAIKIIKTRSRMQTTFTHASSNVSIRVEETASNCGTENVCKLEHEPPVQLKVLPWVVDGAGGLGAGKTSGAGTRGVDLNAAVGGRTGYTDTNGGESSNNGSKIHVDCYPAESPSL